MTNLNINGIDFNFYNKSRSNRSGFIHESVLYANGQKIGSYKIQYYNRTWEAYQYQSVMKNLVYNLISGYTENYKINYKKDKNIKRLTEVKKDEMMDLLKNEKEYVILKELYNSI